MNTNTNDHNADPRAPEADQVTWVTLEEAGVQSVMGMCPGEGVRVRENVISSSQPNPERENNHASEAV